MIEINPGIKDTAKWISMGLLVLVCGLAAYKLFDIIDENSELSVKLTNEENVRKLAESNRDLLAGEIESTNAKIGEIKAANDELKKSIEISKGKIASIAKQRDAALQRIEEMQLPESCEDKFRWMREQAESLEERYQ